MSKVPGWQPAQKECLLASFQHKPSPRSQCASTAATLPVSVLLQFSVEPLAEQPCAPSSASRGEPDLQYRQTQEPSWEQLPGEFRNSCASSRKLYCQQRRKGKELMGREKSRNLMGITWLKPATLPNKQMALGKVVCREKWRWRHGFLTPRQRQTSWIKHLEKVTLNVMCKVLVT